MTNLRHTGTDIPKRLLADLGPLAPYCIGYDFADKGDLIGFSRRMSVSEIAARLGHGDVQELEGNIYLLRNDED